MTQDEQFVREHWGDIEVISVPGYAGVEVGGYTFWNEGTAASPLDDCWKRAAAFTCSRLEAIRLVEEEIRWMELFPGPIGRRILAARQAALNELKKGWRALAGQEKKEGGQNE